MMSFDKLKEDIRNIEYELEYGEEQHIGRVAVNVKCLRSVIDFANEAIARQTTTSEEVKDAIEELMFGGWQSYKDGYPITLGDKTIYLAITALQEYQPWTPTSDRLPEEYRFVLISIFNGKATGVGMIDKKKRWYGIDHQEMDITPEAWKPLPEPLKGE